MHSGKGILFPNPGRIRSLSLHCAPPGWDKDGRRTHAHQRQPSRPRRRLRHRAPAPRHGQRLCLLSLEDETGIANAIVTPDIFERDRVVVTRSRFLRVEGLLQNQGRVIHLKAERLIPLEISNAETRSHDFH